MSETVKDTDGEGIVIRKKLTGKTEALLYWTGVLMAAFHLWVNTVGIMPEIQRNAVHFGFILFMGYLLYPFTERLASKLKWLDGILAVLSVCAALYLVLFEV